MKLPRLVPLVMVAALAACTTLSPEEQRQADEETAGHLRRLAGARRSRLLRDIARVSTARLLALTDPMGISGAAS